MAKLIEITGKALSGEWGSDDTVGNGIPVLRTTNFTNDGIVDYQNVVTRIINKKNIEEKYLRNGDIIIEKSGGSDKQPVGRVVYFNGEENTYLFNNFTGVLRVKDDSKWYSRYVFYSLFSNYRNGGTRRFENKTTGLHNLKIDDYVSSFEIIALPMYEQKDICCRLDKIQEIIALRKKQLIELDMLVKARFVEMFGDVIRNERGWKQYKFSDVSQSRLGKMLDTKQQTGKYKYPYLANFNVQWFKIRTDNLNEMDFSDADKEEFELIDGDLLICEGGEIGRCAVWHNEIQPCYFQKALHRVRCNKSIILPDYMAYWFKYNCDNNGFAEVEGAMSTIPHLTGAKLKSLKITVPSIELQEEFVALLKLVDKSKFGEQKLIS